ncbi:MAG: carbohydrate kinase family protein [Alkalispirochaetaceae bacterium]
MILHCGEALIDFIPVLDKDGNSAYKPAPGGSPYNSSIASSRLGVKVFFLGRISRDFFGDQLVRNLERNGVDTSYIVRSEQPSTLAFVKKSATGEARYAFYTNDAADRGLVETDLPRSLPEELHAIVFGSISMVPDPVSSTILSLVEAEADRRVISFDPNIRPMVIEDEADYRSRLDRSFAASTIVKISDEDLRWIFPDLSIDKGARKLVTGRTKLVVVTLGADGGMAVTGNGTVRMAGVETEVSDTVGAGDSFHSALLAWLFRKKKLTPDRVASLEGSEIESMLSFAVRVAAKTCSRPGADPPYLREIAE